MEKELIEFFEEMKKNMITEVGYIFLPDIKGYKVFKIPKDRLDIYLAAESLHNKAINSDNPEDNSNALGGLYKTLK